MRPYRLALIGLVAGLAASWAGYRAFDLLYPSRSLPTIGVVATPPVDPATIRFDTLSGERRTISDWNARYLVVNFWGTWCAPCMREIPVFMRMQDALRDRGVQFIGVAVDDIDAVRTYATEVAINYPVLIGEEPALLLNRQLGNTTGALPFTVVLDAERSVLHEQLGEWHEADIERYLTDLVSSE